MRALKLYILVFFLFCGMGIAHAQEMLLPVFGNPGKLNQKFETLPRLGVSTAKSADGISQDQPLTLPFWDDFSHAGPYPDQQLWADGYVFINNSYAVHPMTIGVATFDAIGQDGLLYSHIEATNTPYLADLLTSRAIRLDSVFDSGARQIAPADSVILSFYYQPQGKAGFPGVNDSLVLQFLHTPGFFYIDDEGEILWEEDVWRSVWQAAGESLRSFANDTFPYFKRVAIDITDPVYFRKDFRFRFMNYVSFPLSGPTIQNYAGHRAIWNIDYVYLNSNRSKLNTSYFDIAFAAMPQSILKHYSSMPWSHFIANPQQNLRENFNIAITNLDRFTYPYSYRYIIQDEAGNNLRNYSGGTWNIGPFATSGYQQYQPHANPIVIANPLPTAPAEERHFDIVHILRAGVAGDNRQRNDTVTFRQSFSNYFAYDDGIPETGYGVHGRFPKIAYRFVAGKTDNLRTIDIWFNQTVDGGNTLKPYKVIIWKSILPEAVILYESENQFLDPEEQPLNRFISYDLTSNIQLTDTFYIGIEHQGIINNPEFLSIGFDFSVNNSHNLFFDAGTGWERSIEKGALMIRPVFGAQKSFDDPAAETETRAPSATIYPNPAPGNHITILREEETNELRPARIDIIDVYGKLVYSDTYHQTLDVSFLVNGVYFLRIVHKGNRHPETTPFIIAR